MKKSAAKLLSKVIANPSAVNIAKGFIGEPKISTPQKVTK